MKVMLMTFGVVVSVAGSRPLSANNVPATQLVAKVSSGWQLTAKLKSGREAIILVTINNTSGHPIEYDSRSGDLYDAFRVEVKDQVGGMMPQTLYGKHIFASNEKVTYGKTVIIPGKASSTLEVPIGRLYALKPSVVYYITICKPVKPDEFFERHNKNKINHDIPVVSRSSPDLNNDVPDARSNTVVVKKTGNVFSTFVDCFVWTQCRIGER